MTREEAIETLGHVVPFATQNGEKIAGAIDMAIEALSQPNYETDTEVRLSVTNRKKEKVILWDSFGSMEYVPSADTIQGKWIENEIEDTCRWVECSECHKEYPNIEMNFCPNCGAIMDKGGDAE